jgi:hypothetical protein
MLGSEFQSISLSLSFIKHILTYFLVESMYSAISTPTFVLSKIAHKHPIFLTAATIGSTTNEIHIDENELVIIAYVLLPSAHQLMYKIIY